MVTFDELVAECERLHIELEYTDLDDQINGFYVYDGNYSAIALSHRLKDNPPLRNVVLAEELGHFYTLSHNNAPKKYWSRLDRVNFDKYEAKAIRWAAFRLISQDDIRLAVADGVNTLASLAERFQVTQGLMYLRLQLPDVKIVRE